MFERCRESREFFPDEAIEECVERPEILDELSREELDKMFEFAQSKIIEIFEPHLKARYRSVIQKILQKYASNPTNSTNSRTPGISINESYEISTPTGRAIMGVNISKLTNFHQLALIDIDPFQIIRHESQGYLCTIHDRAQRFYINLKLFILKTRDGTESRHLFIADWYVAPELRDNGIGSQLQQLAHGIGKQNGCSKIFCVISPEDPNDLARLKATNEKMGYEIAEVGGSLVAQKSLQTT